MDRDLKVPEPTDKVKSARPAFTPGPWRVGWPGESDTERFILTVAGSDSNKVEDWTIVVSGHEDDWGIEQGVLNEADARLIAAAPEMYEALRYIGSLDADGGPHEQGTPSFHLVSSIAANARAALKKVTDG